MEWWGDARPIIISTLKVREQPMSTNDTAPDVDPVPVTPATPAETSEVVVSTAQQLLSTQHTSGRRFMAIMMAVCTCIMSLAYTAVMVYVSYIGRALPDWTSMLIPFLGPMLVVWQYNGVLTKERRDVLATALNAVPGGFFSSFFSALSQRKKKTSDDTPSQA